MSVQLNAASTVGAKAATRASGPDDHQQVIVEWYDGAAIRETGPTAPLPVGLRDADGTDIQMSSKLGSLTEAAPANDTASSGLNGRLQRIAQRLSTIIGLLPTALGSNGGLKIDQARVSTYHRISTADNNAAVIKASPGAVRAIRVFTTSFNPVYLKLYDSISTPSPAGGTNFATYPAQAGLPANIMMSGGGRATAAGIAMALVTGITDTDNTAVNANETVVEIEYE